VITSYDLSVVYVQRSRYVLFLLSCVTVKCCCYLDAAVNQNATQSKSSHQVPSVRQVVDSTYIGIVVGTLAALILLLILVTVLVLQRRRICKRLISFYAPNGVVKFAALIRQRRDVERLVINTK